MTTDAIPPPLIAVTGLKKYYPSTSGQVFEGTNRWIRAVDGVSFAIASGETLGLVGETGCGKTTMARMVLLVERPTGGDIFFRGKSTSEFTKADRRSYRASVQAVFQDPGSSLNPRMRVDDIIAEPLHAARQTSRNGVADRVNELLDAVGLPRSASRRFPHEFSGGQRQRIAIARAIAPRPRLIVLDEPVSALDMSVRAQLMNLLKELQTEFGVSYLLIAHDLATVRYLADRVSVMYLGRIVESGRAADLFESPLHPYTRALISASLSTRPDPRREMIVLRGEVPSPLRPPTGCSFHPRCPFAMERCTTDFPLPRNPRLTQTVSCHLFQEGEELVTREGTEVSDMKGAERTTLGLGDVLHRFALDLPQWGSPIVRTSALRTPSGRHACSDPPRVPDRVPDLGV